MTVTISRETAQLAICAMQQLNEQEAYHNRLHAIDEIKKAMAESAPNAGSPCLVCGGRVVYPMR